MAITSTFVKINGFTIIRWINVPSETERITFHYFATIVNSKDVWNTDLSDCLSVHHSLTHSPNCSEESESTLRSSKRMIAQQWRPHGTTEVFFTILYFLSRHHPLGAVKCCNNLYCSHFNALSVAFLWFYKFITFLLSIASEIHLVGEKLVAAIV